MSDKPEVTNRKILVCSADASQIVRLQGTLSRRHSVQMLNAWRTGGFDFGSIDAVVLDSTLTPNKGMELIQELYAGAARPLLYLTAPDDPLSAIEALRVGASGFLVKTDKMYEVLELALAEAIRSFEVKQQYESTIHKLSRQITSLQVQVERLSAPSNLAASSTDPVPAAANAQPIDRRRILLQTIIERFNRGEVTLPTYPDLSRQLDTLINNNADVDEMSKLLSKDSAIAAKLISVSNSALYRRGGRENRTVDQAVTVLGVDVMLKHVTLMANRALYTARNETLRPIFGDLWRHAAMTAQLSHLVAAKIGFKPLEDAFSMGLFHDIGKLFLLQIVAELQGGRGLEGTLQGEQLAQFLESNHGIFGKKLLEIWKLPARYVEVAQWHVKPDQLPGESLGPRIVYLADLLAARAGVGDGAEAPTDEAIATAAETLGVEPHSFATMIETASAFVKVSEN